MTTNEATRVVWPNWPVAFFSLALAGRRRTNCMAERRPALAGYTDCMIAQWLAEYVLVPLELVTLGQKSVYPGSLFWKQVLGSTGQPSIG